VIPKKEIEKRVWEIPRIVGMVVSTCKKRVNQRQVLICLCHNSENLQPSPMREISTLSEDFQNDLVVNKKRARDLEEKVLYSLVCLALLCFSWN